MELNFTDLAILAGQGAPEILLFSPPESWDYRHALPCLAFCVSAEDPDSGLRARTASILLTEASPQPHMSSS